MAVDHELKLGRARQHLQDLDSQIQAWLHGYICSVRQEYDPNATPADFPDVQEGFYMLGGSVVMPPHEPPEGAVWGQGAISVYLDDVPEQPAPDGFGLVIGEILHNLRSALDTLAYSLTLAGTAAPTNDLLRDSEFAIIGDENRAGVGGQGSTLFASARRKFVGWQPGAEAVLQGLQPYQRGNDFRDDPLWVLHDLDRINKHRFIHTVTAYSLGFGWRPTETVNLRAVGPGMICPFSGPVEPGAPVLRMFGILLVDPDAEVHVEAGPTPNVVFDRQTPAVGENPVIESLALLFNHVHDTVIPALSPYL